MKHILPHGKNISKSYPLYGVHCHNNNRWLSRQLDASFFCVQEVIDGGKNVFNYAHAVSESYSPNLLSNELYKYLQRISDL